MSLAQRNLLNPNAHGFGISIKIKGNRHFYPGIRNSGFTTALLELQLITLKWHLYFKQLPDDPYFYDIFKNEILTIIQENSITNIPSPTVQIKPRPYLLQIVLQKQNIKESIEALLLSHFLPSSKSITFLQQVIYHSNTYFYNFSI